MEQQERHAIEQHAGSVAGDAVLRDIPWCGVQPDMFTSGAAENVPHDPLKILLIAVDRLSGDRGAGFQAQLSPSRRGCPAVGGRPAGEVTTVVPASGPR